MTDEELRAARELYARKKAGWDYMEMERRRNLRALVTKEVLPSFDEAFRHTLTLPPRLQSGFTELYRILSRSSKR